MQDIGSIKFYPIDLSEHGKTPTGLPIYRVVWADSRVEKVEYEGAMYPLPLYEDKAKGKWILEKWLPVEKFIGMTREEFSEAGKRLGGVQMEYASSGEYSLSDIFPGAVTSALAHLWATQINAGMNNYTNAERAAAVRKAYQESIDAAEVEKDKVIHAALDRKEAHA